MELLNYVPFSKQPCLLVSNMCCSSVTIPREVCVGCFQYSLQQSTCLGCVHHSPFMLTLPACVHRISRMGRRTARKFNCKRYIRRYRERLMPHSLHSSPYLNLIFPVTSLVLSFPAEMILYRLYPNCMILQFMLNPNNFLRQPALADNVIL